ncbi:MAG: SDR family oxidoreductase [Alphaproteobacteria bacterium]|nr:SDR family oxidoreductase [Alphaproteobacteria bacterium]
MADTRSALVTGATRGIGLEIARQLARQGVLTALGARDEQKGEAAVAELAGEGLEAVAVQLDVAEDASVKSAVEKARHLFGRIDILVNNAGILLDRDPSGVASRAADVSIETVLQTFNVNTVGALRMMQAVLPDMQAEGYGRVVNLSSGMGQLSDMGAEFTAYRMSKAALNALTRTAAADLVDTENVKINSVCPGWVQTDMGGPNAHRSVSEGADTAVWLATLDDDGPTGGFFRDRKPIAW